MLTEIESCVEPEPINADEEEGGNGDGGTRRRRNPETEEAGGGMRKIGRAHV